LPFLLTLLLIFVNWCRCFDYFVIWRHQRKRHERVKIAIDAFKHEKTCDFHSFLWMIFFISRNDFDFMRKILNFRIAHREVDYFDWVKIQIEFFVMILLKFIKNDHFSWMRNIVDFAEWMQKKIVKWAKMSNKFIST
jgi:hypothetical protein